jgi:hypothetical protein
VLTLQKPASLKIIPLGVDVSIVIVLENTFNERNA